MEIQGYKCPNCGGTVKFDSSAQKMKCPFCDTEFEIAALEEHQQELSATAKDDYCWDTKGACEAWDNPEQDDLTTGACPSCGAEIFGDQSTIATVCPCCGNAQIVAKRLSGMLKPNYVIPFKLKKDSAVEELKKFCKGKRLLPNNYLEDKRIKEIQGIYAPFWLYDAKAHGHICYRAHKVRTWSDSNYIYTKTDHYSVVRDGDADFEKIPVDASEKLDDDYMDAIEPYDYANLADFHQSFLAGYLAEKYDVDAEGCKDRAGKRMKGTIENEFRKSVAGYTMVKMESSAVDVKSGKVNYALLPVWVLNTKYRDENYQFMMNGQTGRLVGRLPVDRGKAWKWRGILTGVVGLIATLAVLGLSIFGEFDSSSIAVMALVAWGIAIAAGFGIVYKWKRGMDTARRQTCATGYMVSGSLTYKTRTDRFLFSTVKKIPKPKIQPKR
ncbi:MAG: hypothetical protein LBU70_09650 [Chitinispirillales bacterium]|jgi:predicted RNA-binding Zn-ribbon protein involved in translation (DUF1610 family)|nr:hypothetical protein [Chitinispirillales bacterium]